MYATERLSDADKAEVMRAQTTKVGDWQTGRLRALLISTASAQDRQEIQQAIDHQYGGAA